MFKTDWICILTSGHTVDGRQVSAEVIQQIADTYSPDVYNARINVEHSPYGMKLGSVIAVKAEKDGDKLKLYAQLKPNDYFLYLVKNGQKLHTSCEIVEDFAKTGKAYLTAIAVTDSPASLGTTEMHLSVEGQTPSAYSTQEVIEPQKPTLNPLRNLFNKEDDSMDQKATLELLSQIVATQGETNQALKTLSENLSTQPTPKCGAPADPVTETEPEEGKTELAALKAQVKELSTNLESTNATINELTQKLASQTDEPDRKQADGADLNLDEVL